MASHLAFVQLTAMLASLVVFSYAAWVGAPWLRTGSRNSGLKILLWAHVPRYITLILYSAQHSGYPISDAAAFEAVVGDCLGALLAFAALISLQVRPAIGIALGWLLVIETVADMAVGVVRKSHEPLWGKAVGVTWVILDMYIPLLIVTLPLLSRQLLLPRSHARQQAPAR